MPTSVFAQYRPKGYPHRFAARAHVDVIAGGIPTNPEVAEAWIRAKGYKDLKDELIAEEVMKVMKERGVSETLAVEEVARNRHLSGFKRDATGLYVEGRQLKACIKEAASVAADAGKVPARGLGENNSRKGIVSFVAEHIFVEDYELHLEREDGTPVTEPDEVNQSFVHTFRGSGISYSELVRDAEFDFTVETDKDFDEEEWAMIWLTAEYGGLGAGRSQGYGRFQIVKWEPIGHNGSRSGNGSRPRRRVTRKAVRA